MRTGHEYIDSSLGLYSPRIGRQPCSSASAAVGRQAAGAAAAGATAARRRPALPAGWHLAPARCSPGWARAGCTAPPRSCGPPAPPRTRRRATRPAACGAGKRWCAGGGQAGRTKAWPCLRDLGSGLQRLCCRRPVSRLRTASFPANASPTPAVDGAPPHPTHPLTPTFPHTYPPHAPPTPQSTLPLAPPLPLSLVNHTPTSQPHL